MKRLLKILLPVLLMTTSVGMLSCSEEEFGPSIFREEVGAAGNASITFPLDSFCRVSFLEPYNMRFIYRMEDNESDMNYNLVPCSYEQSLILATLCKYLWYDVYRDNVENGGVFLKKYSPRMIHVIGSPAYNPVQGTEVLGTAEGGIKITLYNGNALSPDDIDYMNEYFFKTMHHEFFHILNQNVNRPVSFDALSAGKYNPNTWTTLHDSVAAGMGFVSPYASSQSGEDWVEVMANYIVKDIRTWDVMMSSASFEWESVGDVEASVWDKLNEQVNKGKVNRDSVGYYAGVSSYSENGTPMTYTIVRKLIQRNATGSHAVTDQYGNIVYLHTSGVRGNEVIDRKLQMCRMWMKQYFNVDLDKIRMAVQHRQWLTDDEGNFILDVNGDFINGLTFVRPDGGSVIDDLVRQVLELKSNADE